MKSRTILAKKNWATSMMVHLAYQDKECENEELYL